MKPIILNAIVLFALCSSAGCQSASFSEDRPEEYRKLALKPLGDYTNGPPKDTNNMGTYFRNKKGEVDSIHISSVKYITEGYAKHLEHLPHLRMLRMNGLKFSDEQLSF